MTRIGSTVLGVCAAAILATAAGSEPPSGGDPGTPAARPTKIVMKRMSIPQDLENPDPIRIKFENHLAGQLRAAGLTVIPPESFESLQDAVTDSLGGFFDAETGEIDSTRLELIDAAVRRAAVERLGAEAVIISGIVVVGAPAVGGYQVRWHGAKDNCNAEATGYIPAYSIYVLLEGADGQVLHEGAGGIQLARKFHAKSFIDETRVLKDVKRKDLFTKEERNLHAVRMALTPFAAREKPED